MSCNHGAQRLRFHDAFYSSNWSCPSWKHSVLSLCGYILLPTRRHSCSACVCTCIPTRVCLFLAIASLKFYFDICWINNHSLLHSFRSSSSSCPSDLLPLILLYGKCLLLSTHCRVYCKLPSGGWAWMQHLVAVPVLLLCATCSFLSMRVVLSEWLALW